MKIRITLDFDERVRRAIAHIYGKTVPASRSDCESWIDGIITGTLADVCKEYDEREKQS